MAYATTRNEIEEQIAFWKIHARECQAKMEAAQDDYTKRMYADALKEAAWKIMNLRVQGEELH